MRGGSAMGAKKFEELVCWQLARALKQEVYRLCDRPGCRQDWKMRNQLREAIAGPPAHIAEGFGRRRPRDFARFLTIARASLDEARNHLIDGIDRGYWTEADLREINVLMKRTVSAIVALKKYLENCDPDFAGPPHRT